MKINSKKFQAFEVFFQFLADFFLFDLCVSLWFIILALSSIDFTV